MNSIHRLTLTIFGLLIFIISAQSQPIMGFQAGINISGFRGEQNFEETKPRLGLTGYVFTDIPLGRNSIVSIETGLRLSQQGNTTINVIDSISWTNTKTTHNKLNYIIFPLYLKENYSNFYTKIGPYAAYLLNAESRWANIETKGPTQIKPDYSGNDKKFEENVSKFDYGLSFGFGFIHFFDPNIYRNKRHRNKRTPVLQVDFKYNLGLKSIDDSGKIDYMALKNHVFTVGLSITSVYN